MQDHQTREKRTLCPKQDLVIILHQKLVNYTTGKQDNDGGWNEMKLPELFSKTVTKTTTAAGGN